MTVFAALPLVRGWRGGEQPIGAATDCWPSDLAGTHAYRGSFGFVLCARFLASTMISFLLAIIPR
jgi:hypothetical protein